MLAKNAGISLILLESIEAGMRALYVDEEGKEYRYAYLACDYGF